MKVVRNRKILNRAINIVMLISTITLFASFRNINFGAVETNVKSVHVVSKDGDINFYTENASYCKFLELYFDSFVSKETEDVHQDQEQDQDQAILNYDINSYPLEINIITRFGEKISVLLDQSQYEASLKPMDTNNNVQRSKSVPTMTYLITVGDVNYFVVNGTSDNVLNMFINSIDYNTN